jgi:hypothetical protein
MSGRRWWMALGAAVAISVAVAASAWFLVLPRLMPAPGVPAPLDPAQAALAVQFLDHLDADDPAAALALATPKVRQGLGAAELGELWKGLPATLGERRRRHPPRGETVDGRPVVTISLEFAAATLDARVVFDQANLVAGFRLVPGRPPQLELVANDRFEESAVQGCGRGPRHVA